MSNNEDKRKYEDKKKIENLSVIFASLKMALATFSSRILGLVREQAMAAYFGASGLTDAFLVAYRVPNLLRDLFAEGAFSAAFVPTFTKANSKSKEMANELLWSSTILLGAITAVLSILIMAFAPLLIKLFAPSFVENPEKFEITLNLIRIMAPFLFFISLAALMMGALNSLKVFFIPALAPAVFNMAMIACIFVLTPLLKGQNINTVYALGIGVLLGGIFQVAIQLPLIWKKSFRPIRPKKILNSETREIIHKLGPGLIGFAATQINLIVNTILATTTVVGAVSWLSYAFRLFQFPVGILSVSIAGSNLVHFSQAWKSEQKQRALDYLKLSYDLSLFVIIPAMALMYALSTTLTHLVFERGKWQFVDTLNTSDALKYYILGLPFYGLYKILVPTFYTMDKQKIPVYSSLVSITLNIIFCVLMVSKYGFEILALGTTLSISINCLIQSFVLKRDLNLDLSFFFDKRFTHIIIAGCLSYLSADILNVITFNPMNSFVLKSWYFVVCSVLGLIIYVLTLLILGEAKVLNIFLSKKK